MNLPPTPPNSKYFDFDKSDNKTICFLIYLPKFGPVPVPVKDLVQGAEGRYWRGLIAAAAYQEWGDEWERVYEHRPSLDSANTMALMACRRDLNAASCAQDAWREWGRETEKGSAL